MTQPSDVRVTVDRLVRDRPSLQIDRLARPVDYGISRRLVPYLCDLISPGTRTIETGSGLSTLVCLLCGAEHVAISPDAGEPDRIRAAAREYGIPTDHYTPVTARSEDVLPHWTGPRDFSLALIDGNHAFPAPSLDWFFVTRLLAVGAAVVIDDTQLWPCRIVADVLDREAGCWERLARTERFAIYRLLVAPEKVLARGWRHQPYVNRRSRSRLAMLVERALRF